jgi:WD40 repeat protein/energy-coupling factor transporter ATP-binding protein EcfA2
MAEPVSPADFTVDLSNPFPGLRSFEPYEDYLYFGREDHTMELLTRLQKTRFLSVVGTSGSGKSSLVRAGLVPSLHGGLMTSAGSSWQTVLMRPGVSPITNLANGIERAVRLPDAEVDQDRRMFLEASLRSSSLGLVDSARHVRAGSTENMLVLVDQFEEIFRFRELSAGSREEGAAFVKLLLEAAESAERLYIVLTMRSDFIGRCMEFHGLPQAINEGQYLLPRLSRDELRLAITGPVGVRGAKISPRLVSRLLNDIIDGQDQLPVLQHALMRMWGYWNATRGSGDAVIDLDHYREIGTMRHALSKHAEKIYDHYLKTDRRKMIAEKLFKALTEKDREGRGIRRPTRVREVADIAAATVEEVIEVIEPFRFAGRSFLMPPPPQPGISGVELTGDTTIDLSHESLMRKWETLIRWTDQESKSAELYRRLSEAAELNEAKQAALWRTPELDIALKWRQETRPTEAWARRYNPAFSRAMRYLDRSRMLRAVKRIGLAVAIVGVAVGLATWAALRNNEARLQAILNEQDPLRRVLLLDELDNSRLVRWFRSPSDEMDLQTLQSIATSSVPRALLRDPASLGGMVGGAYMPIVEGEPQRVWTVSASGAVRLWRSDGLENPAGFGLDDDGIRPVDLESGDPRRGEVAGVVFSSDREWLAVRFRNGSGWYGRTSGEERFRRIPSVPGSKITALAFSPENRKLATGDDTYKVRIWNLESGSSAVLGEAPDRHIGEISSVDFDRTGQLLVSASWDGTARVWDVARPDPPKPPLSILENDQQIGLTSASFSPDGDWIVGASSNGLGRIWRRDGRESNDLTGHTAAMTNAIFSPTGEYVATSSEDGTVRIWATTAIDPSSSHRIIDPELTRVIATNHDGVLRNIVLNSNGEELLTVALVPLSRDEPARVWSTRRREPKVLGRHKSRVTSLAFSRDGESLVTSSQDRMVSVWPIHADREVGTSKPILQYEHGDWVRRAVFDTSGMRVASASEDCTVQVRAIEPPAEKIEIKLYPSCDPTPRAYDDNPNPPESRFLTVAFDPAGERLVTAGFDREMRPGDPDLRQIYRAHIWDLGGALERPELILGRAGGHSDRIWRAEFDPDGTRVVTASADHTARIWDSRTGESLTTLSGHADRVLSAAFHPTGDLVVTASQDRTAQIWSSTGESRMVLNHGAGVTDAGFSADGERVVTATQDGIARVWDVADGKLELELSLGGEMWAVAFSPDGNHVATGSRDGSVVLWRVSRSELQRYAQSASTACLDMDWRVRFLAESETTARRRFAECQRRYGRR